MRSSLIDVVRCPYCRRERTTGVTFMDIDSVLAANQEYQEGPGIRPVTTSPRPLLIYDADGTENQPCSHSISHVVDAELVRRHGEIVRAVALEDSWGHQWFEHHDPDKAYDVFLWTEVGHKIPNALDPSSPHVIERFRRSICSPIPGWTIRFSGTFIFAQNADEFLQQLKESYWRVDDPMAHPD